MDSQLARNITKMSIDINFDEQLDIIALNRDYLVLLHIEEDLLIFTSTSLD